MYRKPFMINRAPHTGKILLAAVVTMSLLAAAPSPAQASGILDFFKKKESSESSSGPIFMEGSSGNTGRAGKNNSGAYRNYGTPQDDSAQSEMPAHFKEQMQRIEAEEARNLAARDAERRQRIKELNKKQMEEFEKIRDADFAESQKRRQAIDDRVSRMDEQAAGQRERSNGGDGQAEDSKKVRQIYKKPDSSEDQPSRVFRNFR